MIATVRVLPSWHLATHGMQAAVTAAVLVWVAGAAALNGMAVRSNPGDCRFSEVAFERSLRDAVRDFPLGSAVYVDNGLMPVKNDTFPGVAAVSLLLFPDQHFDGHPVYFVEPDADLLQRLRALGDKPIGRIVVAPGDVPADAHYYRPAPRQRAHAAPTGHVAA